MTKKEVKRYEKIWDQYEKQYITALSEYFGMEWPEGFENITEDTQWMADHFMPMAVEYGCKCIYFIIDENNSLKEELEGQASDSSDKIEFRYIYSLDGFMNNLGIEKAIV